MWNRLVYFHLDSTWGLLSRCLFTLGASQTTWSLPWARPRASQRQRLSFTPAPAAWFAPLPSPLACHLQLAIAMATSSCQAGCLYRSRGGAVGVGEERRSLRRCLLQVPGWFWAHTILQEGGGSSDAAAAAVAASTVGTLVELERVVPIAPSLTREGGE